MCGALGSPVATHRQISVGARKAITTLDRCSQFVDVCGWAHIRAAHAVQTTALVVIRRLTKNIVTKNTRCCRFQAIRGWAFIAATQTKFLTAGAVVRGFTLTARTKCRGRVPDKYPTSLTLEIAADVLILTTPLDVRRTTNAPVAIDSVRIVLKNFVIRACVAVAPAFHDTAFRPRCLAAIRIITSGDVCIVSKPHVYWAIRQCAHPFPCTACIGVVD